MRTKIQEQEDRRDRQELVDTLVEVRKAKGMTQYDVATLMGISQGAVTYVERGDNPRLSTLQRYAKAVGVVLDIKVES